MAFKSTTKQSYEKYFINGDFSNVLDSGETIAGNTITVVDRLGTDVTATLVDTGSAFIDGSKQFVRIKDGEQANSPYKITIRIITSAGNKYEVDGLIIVEEL